MSIEDAGRREESLRVRVILNANPIEVQLFLFLDCSA